VKVISDTKVADKVEIKKIKDNAWQYPTKILKTKYFNPFTTKTCRKWEPDQGLSLCYDIVKAYGGEIK